MRRADVPAPAPIDVAVTVACPQDEAFTLFVETIGDWWPLGSYSISADAIVAIDFDRRVGGFVEEVYHNGERARWGTVTSWEPPHRFAMTWEVTPGMEQTNVEVQFHAVGASVTRVRLVHTGWETLDPSMAGRMGSYSAGWQRIMAAFAQSVPVSR